MKVRFHDLRHFSATQLIGAGVDVRTVAHRLGHADPSTTLRVYAHALAERDREAAAILGKLVGTRGAPSMNRPEQDLLPLHQTRPATRRRNQRDEERPTPENSN